MRNLSTLLNQVEDSAVSQIITKAAKAGWKDTIHLAGGEPRFDLPPQVKNFLNDHNLDKITKYSPFKGYPDLIDLIQNKIKDLNSINASTEELITVPGGSSALYSALMATLNPAEEILISNPCWEHYTNIIKLARAIPKPFRMVSSNGRYEIDLTDIKSKISPNTKAILLNTPLNPLGSVLSKDEINQIIQVCEDHNLWLIVDEEYETFIFDNNKHLSIRSFYDKTITLYSFSKSFALTGIRLGYIVAPKEVVNLIRRLGLYTYMFPSSPSQCIAISILKDDSYKMYLEDVRQLYQEKMAFFYNLLQKIPNIKCWRPEGGVYLFPKIERSFKGSIADKLIDTHHLLCVPGAVAGNFGENHLRFFIGASNQILKEAALRLTKCIRHDN